MEIILYSTGCIKCTQLKMLLDSFGVPYTVNDSVEDMLKLGFSKVPVLAVNGSFMDYSEARNWIINTYKE